MNEFWRSKSHLLAVFAVCNLYLLNLSFCWSLNDEGVALLRFKEKIVSDPYGALSNWIDEVGVESPCSWFGVECSEGYVVVLNLKDLCLRGHLAPHIGNLIHVKSIILRNNSFFGVVPEEVANLKELEVLDIGYNNFSGQLPCHLCNKFSMMMLLLENNELLGSTCSENCMSQMLSEVEVEDDLLSRPKQALSCIGKLISWKSPETRDMTGRKLLQEAPPPFVRRPAFRFLPPPQPPRILPPPLLDPPPLSPTPSPSPAPLPSARPLLQPSPPSRSAPTERTNAPIEGGSRSNRKLILSAAIGGPLLLLLLIVGVVMYRSGKVTSVKPWATGLSGQLQRALVTGVPKLKRSELVAACEDFSNVIDSSAVYTFYKGTLSSGVEIAVASIAVTSAKEWPSSLEAQFRKKIYTLAKVNHKNFVSLLGYCEELEPFTRMMVFEYAPNGTLFEHIHIKEAEHLDWATRLRIAMGIAYCLDYMHHHITPPLAHRNLTSSSIYLTEDYAAKISDFVYWDEATDRPSSTQSNVYSFGVILFEMITGKLPYSVGSDSLDDWASDYLGPAQFLREIVDPTLRTYGEDQLRVIGDVIASCVDPDPRRRPSMREVCVRMREITGVGPDGAVPKLSPLWWAELEILSTEATS